MTNGITLTAREATTVLAIFEELQKKTYGELNTFLGSLTIEDMNDLAHKLRYHDYMVEHNITEMTDDDYMNYYYEKYEA